MRKLLLSVFLFVCCFYTSYAGTTIRGVVKDAKTGDALIGASVYQKGNPQKSTTTGLDGSYILRDVADNPICLICKYISYKPAEKVVPFPSSGTGTINFSLSSSELELKGIEVVAANGNSDQGVRNMEKLAPNVINIVSARSMELSPDLSVANALQRVSGVTMERNSSGEGQYAVLRGMDKRYNITLVNGVKISSPDNKQRYVPLDIFPNELLDRLEVSKTRTAEMEGDATGGAINLVMKDAPGQLSIQANAAFGYNTLFVDRAFSSFDLDNVILTAPYEKYGSDYSATMSDFGNGMTGVSKKNPLPNGTAGFSFGNRFFGKRLGLIVAGNYQNFYKGSNSTFFEDEMIQTESTVRLTSMNERTYSEHQVQYGLHSKMDFRLNANNKLEWYNAYIDMSNAQVRQSTSTNFKLNYEPDKGYGDYSYETRIRLTKQQIITSTLQGHHLLSEKLSMDWSAVYSDARQQRPDNTTVNLENLRENYIDNIYADADGSTRRWEHNSDKDYSGILHLHYETDFAFAKITWQAGGLYRDKRRDNFYVNYTFKPSGTQTMGVDFNAIDEIEWTLYTPYGSVGPLNYKASEKIAAGYLQAKAEKRKWELTVGLRAENTDQGYYMYFPNAGDDPDGGQNYIDWLPDVHFNYKYSQNVNCRFSYFRSINRPGFFEIVPYQIINEEYNEYGNENLKRAVIENFDLRWEFFPKPAEQLMIGAFYKKINSPIEYAYYSVNQRQYGYGPVNLGDAKNFGVEVDLIKYIRWFGVKANYTYTHSAITTSKAYYAKEEDGNISKCYANQTRPLVGQAAHVANLSLLLKSIRYGVDAQLAAAYTGDKIVIASHYLDSDYWQKGSVQLDASAEKKLGSNLSFFIKANNLLNTPLIQFIKTANSYNDDFPLQSSSSGETLIRKEYYKQNFLVGIRYKL
jgi:outer membrane receptor protein involved in Fe transport